MSEITDLIGQKFGKLNVIGRAKIGKWGKPYWLCKCNCKDKNEAIVREDNLKSGNTKSCGCLNIEKIKQRFTKHGHKREGEESKTHRSWRHMKERCLNPNNKYYNNYGGRGITIYEEWLEFTNFLKDMGESPLGLTLERKNNEKGYYPDNCRWATPKEQMRNTRRNRLITYNGKTQCLAAYAEEYNFHYITLWNRLYKHKWSIEKALTTPVRKHKKKEYKMSNPSKHEVHLTKEYAKNGFNPKDFQKSITGIADNFTLYDLFVLIKFADAIIPDIAETLGMEEFDLFWNQIRLPRDPDDDDDINCLELCWHPDYDILETPKTGKQTDQNSPLGDDVVNYWDNPKVCEMSNLMSLYGVGSGCPLKDDNSHKCDDECPTETSYGIWPCTLNNLAHLTVRVVPTVEFHPPYVESDREFKRTGFKLTIQPTLWCFITSILYELTFGGSTPNEIKGTVSKIKEQTQDLEETHE